MISFSIITPTVQRESLIDACKSIDEQTNRNWQHIVIIDGIDFDAKMMSKIYHPQRLIMRCSVSHRNGGNTCRHDAWKMATGDYCWHLDDDNFAISSTVLDRITYALESSGKPDWGLFPIFRHGQGFFFDPPQPCHFDTGNAVVKTGIAQWPDIPDYASDVPWLNGLLNYPYKAFPNTLPIMVMPTTSFGKGGGINGE